MALQVAPFPGVSTPLAYIPEELREAGEGLLRARKVCVAVKGRATRGVESRAFCPTCGF